MGKVRIPYIILPGDLYRDDAEFDGWDEILMERIVPREQKWAKTKLRNNDFSIQEQKEQLKKKTWKNH